MRRFWARMVGVYGYRWGSAYGEAAEDDSGRLTLAADTWKRGLSGVAETRIGIGIEACIVSADPWPPTLPAFRAMCFGIPSLGSVRADLALENTKRKPFTLMVWQHIDRFAFGRADQRQADNMLREAYEHARERVMRGEEMPVPVAELPLPEPPKRTPASPTTVKAGLEQIAAILGETETAALDALTDEERSA